MKRLLTALALIIAANFVSAQDMQPGLWEITTKTQMQGMSIPGMTFSYCYTEQDLATGKQFSNKDSGDCQISNMKSAGGNISYDMNCDADGVKMAGLVKGKFTANTYELEQKITMTPDQGMGEMHMDVKGRRLGKCK
ncbi:MAG: DUF3617 family protein [Thiohalomonadaceae bacterium]|jgi:hypothetical protein